jgi:hypothetical protein
MRLLVRFSFVAVGILLPAFAEAQGVLQQARDESQERSPKTDSDSHAKSRTRPFSGDEGFDSGNGDFGLACALAPFVLPRVLFDDAGNSSGYFPGFPYALGPHSYQFVDPEGWAPKNDEHLHPFDDAFLKPWAVRLAVEDGNDFRGLNRLGAQLTVDTESRFGVQSDWSFVQERLNGGGRDHTTLGATELTYRFAQCEAAEMHAGVGFRLRTDDVNTRWGFNFLYGGDWYPAKPVVASSQFEVGQLGANWVYHLRGTLGVAYRHVELFGGYDFLRLGTANIQRPLAGLRFWF